MKNLILLTVIAVASLQVASLAKAADHEEKETGTVVHRFGADSGPAARAPQTFTDGDKVVAHIEDETIVQDTAAHGPNGRMNWTR